MPRDSMVYQGFEPGLKEPKMPSKQMHLCISTLISTTAKMLSLTTFTSTLLATAGLINVASAVTEARLLPGVCRSLPGAINMIDNGNAMVGELNIYAVGTGTYIDGLEPRWGTIQTQPRGAPAFQTV